jgi:hypothetical protein
MAAPVSTKSARERLEKSTGDFDMTDGSTDDGRAAEVAEGRVLMVDRGWCLAIALRSCYEGEKSRRCRLDAMVAICNHSPCTAIPRFQASEVESRETAFVRAFNNVAPMPGRRRNYNTLSDGAVRIITRV